MGEESDIVCGGVKTGLDPSAQMGAMESSSHCLFPEMSVWGEFSNALRGPSGQS